MKNQISNDKILKIVKEAKSKAKKKQLTKISDKSKLSTEDKFKISLCRSFVQYMNERELKPTDLHRQTGIEKSRLSEILHYNINNFTIDRLLSHLNILAEHSPKIRGHLLFLEEAMNTPVMSVETSRKLTKGIRKVSHPSSHWPRI